MTRAHGSRFLVGTIGTLLFACLVILPVSGSGGQMGAEDVVTRMNSALMENMKRAEELRFSGRYRLLDPVLRQVFAFPYMGEKSLGGYWKTLLPEQRKLYLDLYSEWTISTYAGRFDGYSGEHFVTRGEQLIDGNTIVVVSNLMVPNDEGVDFHYTLRRFNDGWRIVDITISGVSQLSMTRAQFVSLMKERGFDGLMAALKEKVALFRARDLEGRVQAESCGRP